VPNARPCAVERAPFVGWHIALQHCEPELKGAKLGSRAAQDAASEARTAAISSLIRVTISFGVPAGA
jgi:hypothetical protein